MRSRAVFVDVDGTLVTHAGSVPASAVAAIRAARARGHLVVLCTGRARAELWPGLLDIGFDGIVGAAGAFVETGGHVLAHHGVSEAALHRALTYFDVRGVDVYLQADEAIYASPAVKRRLQHRLYDGVEPGRLAELSEGPFRFVDRIRTNGAVPDCVTKVLYLACPVPLAELRREFAGEFDIVSSSVSAFAEGSGEMMIPGVHKATGLDLLIDHLGVDLADTIAIGDGYNDLELLGHAAIGIAMGNAPDEVKAVADEVTAAVDAQGLALAFARHGLT